jgi:ABC-2 type transport system ATP-binding protein
MIKLNSITCGYGKTPVQSDITFEINNGDVVMITGPNGVGKSTLLKVLANILYPTNGTVDYDWSEVKDPRQFIGYLPDSLSIYRSMKVKDLAELHWNAFGVHPDPLPLLKKASINWNSRIKELSVGQRVIFHLSLILSTSPRLILVDEILHTVDPYLRSLALETLVKTMADRKPTVVMVNLNYSEVEHLVNRVIFLTKDGILLNETAQYLLDNAKLVASETTPENTYATRTSSGKTEHLVIPGAGKQLKLSDILTMLMTGSYSRNIEEVQVCGKRR